MKIISNGSKWLGEKPDTVKTLLKVIATHILRPDFWDCGNFFYRLPTGRYQASGNFEDLSHVFQIEGTLKEMLPLARALKTARKRPEY